MSDYANVPPPRLKQNWQNNFRRRLLNEYLINSHTTKNNK